MIKLTKSKGTPEEIYEKFVDIQNKYCSFMLTVQEEWVKDSQLVVEYAKRHLANLIDFEPGIAASGHSLGGSTAYALCQNDAVIIYWLPKESTIGYYECPNCNHVYLPDIKAVSKAPTKGAFSKEHKRKLKCPKCDFESYHRRVFSK